MVRNQYISIGVRQKLQMISNTIDNRKQNESIKDLYDVNYRIRQPQVRLIDYAGNNLGILNTKDAIVRAQSEYLDLVLVNSATIPPIARICDYNKFIYETKRNKKEQERKLRENAIHIKEIQLRPGISSHDFEIKLQYVKDWLTENCKVKIVVKFRGRELAYKAKGYEIINTFIEKLDCKVEKAPDITNNIMIAMVAPASKASK